MKATFTVNTLGCTSYLNALARDVGKPLEKVVMFEAAKVIQKCIASTPARQADKIRKQTEFRNRTLWDNGDPEDPAKRGSFVAGYGKHGEGWLLEESNWDGKGKRPRLVRGKSFHSMTEFLHWSDPRWARWQAAKARIEGKLHNVRQAVQSRGVAKNTWFQMAVDLGIAHLVNAPGYVKNAVSRNGRIYKHGFGKAARAAATFFIELRNDSNLVVNRLSGAAILQRAIDGRRAYYLSSVERGFSGSIADISRRYNGITVL